MKLKRLIQRYNPRRKKIEVDDAFISLASQLGYVELYHGEWFFTESGNEALKEGIRLMKEKHDS